MSNYDEKYMINPYLKFIQINSNEVLIKHSGKSIYSKLLEDESKKGIIGKVFAGFRTNISINEFITQEKIENSDDKKEVAEFVKYCIDNNIIIKSNEDPVYSYYRLIMDKKVENIGDLVIGILGVGILGSRVLKNLSTLGVSKFIILDDRIVENDTIELKFFEYDSLQKKQKYVELVAQNSKAVIESFDNYELNTIEEMVEKCDFLICAQDTLKSMLFHRVNLVCIEKNKPWAIAYIDGSECCAGPIFIPGETCCYNEFEIQNDAALPDAMRRDYSIYREYIDEKKNGDNFLILPPYADILSGMLSTEIFKFLSDCKTSLLNACIKMDFEIMDFDLVTILRLPRCPACEKHDGFKNMFL